MPLSLATQGLADMMQWKDGAAVLRVALAGLWTALGIVKAVAPSTFLAYVAGLSGLEPAVAGVLAWGMIVGEIVLGIAIMISPRGPALAQAAGASTLLASAILGFVVFVASPSESCGCFGAMLRSSHAKRLVVAGTLLLLSSTLWRSARQDGGAGAHAR